MSGLMKFLRRIRNLNHPPVDIEKAQQPLQFGILGAARIGPNALIIPAMSHPDVVVAAVASRDRAKAESYAQKHMIPTVYSGEDCYQCLIEDANINVVYIALPNGLHYRWTMYALEQGKHVLVEKPMANTAAEARELVELANKKGLVLLEGLHYTFHPAAQRFKEIIDSCELGRIKSISAEFAVPNLPNGVIFLKDDVRFKYELGGGATMDMGVYPLSAIRYFTSSEPIQVSEVIAVGHSSDAARIDHSMRAHLNFPSSVDADLYADFGMPGWGPFHILPRFPKASIRVQLEHGSMEFSNCPLAHVFHSIIVQPDVGKKRTETLYKFAHGLGEEWWSTYRYQLEAFVNKVRGRNPHVWPKADDSIMQMEWVEKIYVASDIPVRPASVSS